MPYNWDNGYDNTEPKAINIFNDEGVKINQLWGTEWFAEFAYEGRWMVDPWWPLNRPPEEPEPTMPPIGAPVEEPEDPPVEPEPV